MINDFFYKKAPFVSDYFENYLKSDKRFPQSIILEGSDILLSYFFTCELARILNCEKDAAPNCSCTNCSWIKSGKHPSVVNVSPVDFKEDKSTTVISVKQIEKITSSILESSNYHRFFIFSGAKTIERNEIQNQNIEEYKNAGFFIENEEWFPFALNRKIMQEESSNALLKATEEAPADVTFVFLTDSRENIISTIVSRSFIFKIPYFRAKNSYNLEDFFEGYPNISVETYLNRIENFFDKDDIQTILNSMQNYLFEILIKNKELHNLIISDIKKIELAKKQTEALILPKNALETLAVSLSKEGRLL